MRRWHKVQTIAVFEFLTAVKRRGYLIATFGMPLFMAAYGGVVAIPTYFAERAGREPAVYGVVDPGQLLVLKGDATETRSQVPDELRRTLEAAGQGGTLERAMAISRFVFRPFAAESEARAALVTHAIKGYFVLPSDYLGGGVVEVYLPDSTTVGGSDARTAFGNLIRQRLVSGRLDPAIADRVITPMKDARRFSVTRIGTVTDGGNMSAIVRLAVPLIFLVLFLLSVLMTSGYLMQGTATEKENKVVDVLLASANPDEILGGKLLGLGGAGLLQIAVWLVMVLVAGLGAIPLLIATDVQMPWAAIALAIPLFLVAFLFFGSLMLGTGSLGSNMREAQQLAMVWSLTAALPMMMMGVLIQQPHGTIARLLTWIPFSAGPLIMLRASMDPASLAWWEVAGSFALLLVCTRLAIGLGARLFRLGLLSASRPTFREIVRQARLSG